MKNKEEANLISLNSEAPWHLSLIVERIGDDLLCRVHGGAEHVGVVALGRWDGQRACVDKITVGEHKEGELATVVAHQLCRAGQTTVVCLVGIHFDGINREQIEEICDAVHTLSARASCQLEDLRIAEGLMASDGMFSRIQAQVPSFYEDCKQHLRGGDAKRVSGLCEDSGFARDEKSNSSVLLFAPLYLTNACPNDCVYCGFRRSAKFTRTKLSHEEALREAKYLAQVGFRTIDLVTGEIPSDAFVDYVCQIVEGIRQETTIDCINLNLGALSLTQYQSLKAAGATGYHLYQETYDPAIYRKVHRRGRKRDMAHRLEASRRAVEAGFRSMGLGILLGLHDPAMDLASLCAHARVLTELQPDVSIGFSLPRIQPVDKDCSYQSEYEIGDDLFIRCILFLRRTFPDAHLTLSTRESAAIRDLLIPLGITKISAEVKTAPGGYVVKCDDEIEQFSISDQRSLVEMSRVIHKLGLEPVF